MMTSLYRFRPLNTHTIDELRNSYLYFSTIDKLNDPMECFYRLFFNENATLYENLFKHFLAVMHLADIDTKLNGKETFRKDIVKNVFDFNKETFKSLDFDSRKEHIRDIIDSLKNREVWENEIKENLKEVYRRFYPQDSSERVEFRVMEYFTQFKQFVVSELLVCCFSKFEPTNERNCIDLSNNEILMWAHYAGGHSGICLEFDEIRPQISLENKLKHKDIEYKTIENYNIEYIPFSLGLVLSHIEHKYQFLSRPIVIKGLQDRYHQKCESIYHKKLDAWKYEREHRISIPKEKLKNQKLEYKIECLKSITFGKRTPLDKQKQIINLVKNKQPNIAFYKVDIDKNGVFVRENMRLNYNLGGLR